MSLNSGASRAIAVGFATACIVIIAWGKLSFRPATNIPGRFQPASDARPLIVAGSSDIELVSHSSAVLATTFAAVGQASQPVIDEIATTSVAFPIKATRQPVRLPSTSFQVRIHSPPSDATSAKLRLQQGSQLTVPADAVALVAGKPLTLDALPEAQSMTGSVQISVAFFQGTNQLTQTPPVHVLLPSAGMSPPIIVGASGLKYAPVAAGSAVTVFGSDGLLRVEGRNAGADSLTALWMSDNTFLTESTLPIQFSGAAERWTSELTIPQDVVAKKNLKLLVRRDAGPESFAYSAEKLSITIGAQAPSVATPKLAISPFVQINDELLHLTKPEVTVTVSFEGDTVRPEDDVNQDIVLLDDGKVLAFSRQSDKRVFRVAAPDDGKVHDWRIAVLQGNRVLGNSSVSLVRRVEGNLRVAKIEPVDFGTTAGADHLLITFDPNHPLKPPTIQEAQGIFKLRKANEVGTFPLSDNNFQVTIARVEYIPGQNALRLILAAPVAVNRYQLTIGGGLTDVYGNPIVGTFEVPGTEFVHVFEPPPGQLEVLATAPGIRSPTGPYVEFPEFTNPRGVTNGFNPSDKVETRVARLYYYRDAHRVAQIINRDVKSYNYAAVAVQRQLADKARGIADSATDNRRIRESQAVQAAQQARVAEQELAAEEAALNSAREQETQATLRLRQIQGETGVRRPGETDSDFERRNSDLEAERRQRESELTNLASVVAALGTRIQAAALRVQTERQNEVQTRQELQEAEAAEARSREEQFRREVAAAHEDPDTYAPGVPTSDDPVRQVSVSVIGEGLIQLRGPIKGVNIIRQMINQIDAPVGQVRIGVHTVQINGEHEDRMEKVAQRIQTYIDHSRFLTVQSAELLRKATVKVASRRATEISIECPEGSQAERDQRYLHSFFGRDFINELAAMDSEFLRSGNKLLSLHSMDSTSLCAALFVLALANNDTRWEIITEFEQMCAEQLPATEQAYYEAGMGCDCRHKMFCKHKDAFCLMAQNAKFRSFRGFFDAEVVGNDTMTPIQREFIRLAQIFKSRLVTELEYRQRVMERALIEEREAGDRLELLREALKAEKMAKDELAKVDNSRRQIQRDVFSATQGIRAEFAALWKSAEAIQKQLEKANANRNKALQPLLDAVLIEAVKQAAATEKNLGQREIEAMRDAGHRALQAPPENGESLFQRIQKARLQMLVDAISDAGLNGETIEALSKSPAMTVPLAAGQVRITPDPARSRDEGTLTADQPTLDRIQQDLDAIKPSFVKGIDLAKSYELTDEQNTRLNAISGGFDALQARANLNALERLYQSSYFVNELIELLKEKSGEAAELGQRLDALPARVIDGRTDSPTLFGMWIEVKRDLEAFVAGELPEVRERIAAIVTVADDAFNDLLRIGIDYEFALQRAEAMRRPLDHKKFLDMLIDELEDKYIELLEGTRAHTAVMDDHIKKLATALDDDFNTQFYFPAFREVRKASTTWDVSLGQVETTTLLANNRAFGKASPQATMEFDLPRRDIVIKEAMDGAMAAVDDFGALVNDPSFMALTKLGSGQPTSSAQGGTGGFSSVRNVLPSLPSSTAEKVLSQSGPGEQEFGTALEALIPDPAIYKFETGTGFEIRPVIQPDGQSVVFHFNYMYSTNVREPVRADEKHLGRVKQHFIDTDVQTGNYELREVSRYNVALKAARTARGVPLLEDIPAVGILFRPLPSDESSLQQNIILAQSVIFPTLFDLMGLRWAPAVADLDPLRLSNEDFLVRSRRQYLMNRVYDHSSGQVDEFLRIPEGERRSDLYRSQETIPQIHPNGYRGQGLNYRDSNLQEGYGPRGAHEGTPDFIPGSDPEGSPFLQRPGFRPSGPTLEVVPTPGEATDFRSGDATAPSSTVGKSAIDHSLNEPEEIAGPEILPSTVLPPPPPRLSPVDASDQIEPNSQVRLINPYNGNQNALRVRDR